MRNEEPLKINSIPKCKRCGKEYRLSLTKEECLPDCICQYEREQKKKKAKSIINKIQGRKAIVGKRFYNKTFSNFKKESNIKAYNECLGYVRNLEDNLEQGKGLFLTGSVGSGKTHLIAAMVDWIARMTTRRKYRAWIIFITSVDLLALIKYTFDRKNKDDDNTEELMSKLEDCDLLIIDDLGTEKTTDWASELFYKIIDSRYSNLKSTIITTNLTDQELKEKLSERLISRIYEMCKGIKLTGKDYRLEKLWLNK